MEHLEDLDTTIVDLGCGRNKHPEATVGVDSREDTDADIVTDITTGLPFETGSVERIYAFDVLEHISDGLVNLVREVHRVLKPGGEFVVRVPDSQADPPEKNPLHARSFHPEWFYSWDPNRSEHVKWDNFTCIPFSVEQTEKIYVGDFPQRYYRVQTREFTLEKQSDCESHPTVSH